MFAMEKQRRLFFAPASKVRTDIQALRALAVLAVVVYHIWPKRLTGGFVGVDIFFVISGYLMTKTFCENLDLCHAVKSVAKFYAKRIKRLAPAAIVLLTLVLIAVYAIKNISIQLATLP
jgi:peptidoglycan/LPS O-acetylase OafA/YrhL